MNGSVFSPVMPGDPIGIPGRVMPAISGRVHGDMSVDDVALDEHRVAALEIGWNARFAADGGKVIGRLHVNLEPVLS